MSAAPAPAPIPRALPKPPRDVPGNRSMDGLAPAFRRAVERVLAEMRRAGFTPMVVETLRTDARQQFLHGFGRKYDDGRGVVTHSRTAADTYHGYGLAVDIVCERQRWNAPGEFWRALGAAARDEGLLWGNDWDHDGIPVERDPDESFSDRPHIQWPKLRKPSAKAKAYFHAGRVADVWAMCGANR